jgi:hypothetical protein
MAAIEEAALPPGPRRDYSAAQHTVLTLQREGHLGESALLGFAKAHKYEESIAALSALSGVRLSVLDRLIAGDRYDPLLILGRVLNLGWPTVRALMLLWYGPNRTPADADVEAARLNFTRLMPATAERVVNFWRNRQTI